MSHATPLDYQQSLTTRRAPRVWIGAGIILVMWLAIKIPEWTVPTTMFRFRMMMFGPMVGTAAVLIWWLGFSRLPWASRWTGLLALVGGISIGMGLGHASMKPMGMVLFAMPLAITALVLWTLVARNRQPRVFRIGIVTSVLIVWSLFAMLRMDGLKGNIEADISWRWSPTAEDRFLASRQNGKPATRTVLASIQPANASSTDWPGFRGANRDGVARGVAIRTDWNTKAPTQLWKHLIGPGWSSFCVIGDTIFTQEQRGQQEAVVCYSSTNGDEIWAHVDDARFEEAIAGPGPRATPTYADGKLYALGAKGTLNCLDPATGIAIWSRHVAAETAAPLPMWGFSASPLVKDGLVMIITGGPGKAVSAYDAQTGKPAWAAGNGWSYASPQLAHFGGVEQVLFVSQNGVAALDPKDGHSLWQHEFKLPANANRCVQPTIVGDHEVLIGAAFGTGTQCVKVEKIGNQWNDRTAWTNRKINPYYNDMVFNNGFCYGFDNSAFVCFDVATGDVKWRARNYGNGQVLLLADQNLLMIQAESGAVALVDAKPDAHHEIARLEALDDKTWNHPVVANGKLFVRNGKEIACYDVAHK